MEKDPKVVCWFEELRSDMDRYQAAREWQHTIDEAKTSLEKVEGIYAINVHERERFYFYLESLGYVTTVIDDGFVRATLIDGSMGYVFIEGLWKEFCKKRTVWEWRDMSVGYDTVLNGILYSGVRIVQKVLLGEQCFAHGGDLDLEVFYLPSSYGHEVWESTAVWCGEDTKELVKKALLSIRRDGGQRNFLDVPVPLLVSILSRPGPEARDLVVSVALFLLGSDHLPITRPPSSIPPERPVPPKSRDVREGIGRLLFFGCLSALCALVASYVIMFLQCF